jgi:hypothetical protein
MCACLWVELIPSGLYLANMHYLLCGGMHENRNTSRVEKKIHNAEFLKTLYEEKNCVDKKYISLVADVKIS